MARERGIKDIDETLMVRLAELSPGVQRWLKTALQSIRTMPAPHEPDVDSEAQPERELPRPRPRRLTSGPPQEIAEERRPANLEDVITGKADLRDQLDEYPELSGELEGLADIIDMLREVGKQRRKRGEQILREEILQSDDEPAPEEDEDA